MARETDIGGTPTPHTGSGRALITRALHDKSLQELEKRISGMVSNPPAGKDKVVNIFFDKDTDEQVIITQ